MWLYNLVVLAYGLVIRIASLSHQKAKFWIEGRRNWQNNLKSKASSINGSKVVWFHCASLGEFEQGRPLIEKLKNDHPEYKVVLSFFSPSGYEVSKNYPYADVITYLPLDTRSNAKKFLDIINPEFIVFVKYEFWLNFLNETGERKIPCFLVSAVFKDHHPFFKWYGGVFVNSLHAFTRIYVQDQTSAVRLKQININHAEVFGDTRNDRVMAIKNQDIKIPGIESFISESSLIVAGSTWPADEELILKAYQLLRKKLKVKLLIAPHEVDDKSVQKTSERIKASGLTYTFFSKDNAENEQADVLVLDTMGMLSKVYKYANTAYVGGGMHSNGIHNILEPAVFHVSVSFGGKADLSKYNEALALTALGAALAVNSERELADWWEKSLTDKAFINQIDEKLSEYFFLHGNVSQRLMESIFNTVKAKIN